MPNKFSIAVLLPTRGRTDSLSRSVFSMVEKAQQPDRLQLLFGFDFDDTVGLDHFSTVIQPWLDDRDIDYEAIGFESMGYVSLNRYYNTLAASADADWLFVWNDDATMDTTGWDQVIRLYDGQFKILKLHTHNEHPYSIFPVVPRTWFDLLGVLSSHQMIDAEISQMAYMLDIMQIVDITVTHEQSELTGKHDATSQQKYRFEGNADDPRDFHYKDIVLKRHSDCKILSQYMSDTQLDITFFKNVCNKSQDPWEKLKINDINGCMFHFEQKFNI
jgi:hypothetical protein